MARKVKRTNTKDLLSQGVSTHLTKDAKLSLKQLKKDTGISYAQLLRDALKETYPSYF